jgi:hypothetical protein
MRKLTKLLGLSVLAIVAVMAVNASAAQAKWELDGGTTIAGGELLLDLTATVGLGEFLIGPNEGLEIHVHCGKGTATLHLETFAVGGLAKLGLKGAGTATFTLCSVLDFANCTVRSPGSAAGTITASGSGAAAMTGNETHSTLESGNFSTILFEGLTCPFAELEDFVNGKVKLGLPNPTVLAATQSGYIREIHLLFGNEEADLHGTTLGADVLATVSKNGGGNWAIQLTGL